MITDKIVMKTEVVFSEDRLHRYLLKKEWDVKKPRAAIIMTNPSTADMLMMDYTTLYIINNLVKLGFGAVDIVNISSVMTTKFKVTKDILTDEENFNCIVKSAEKSDNVIIAWGKLGENNKAVREIQDKVLERLTPFKDKLYTIAPKYDGDTGFHPLAPQIRFVWVLRKFDLPMKQEKLNEELLMFEKEGEKTHGKVQR